MAMDFCILPLDLIDVSEQRARAQDPAWVEALAVLIAEQGLFHPISVRHRNGRYQLVSGLRRLLALQSLGEAEVPCRVSEASTDDDARLEEVMENLGREELIAMDRCHHLYELKQVWERKYPHTANGGDRKSTEAKIRTQSLRSDSANEEVFGFARANAEKIGLSKRTIEQGVKIWTDLSDLSRDRLIGMDLARKQTELKALSEQSHKRQEMILDLILSDAGVGNVAGALLALDGGVIPNAVEKQLSALRKQVNALPEPVFDRLILDNEDRVIAALKRQGRLE